MTGKSTDGAARRSFLSRGLRIVIAGYVILIVAVAWSLVAARRWALEELATPAAVGEWQAWREDVRQQQSQQVPVRRRVPKSAEPPALVLMRDYFIVSLIGAMLFASLLYWVIAWFVSGIVNTMAPRGQPAAMRTQ